MMRARHVAALALFALSARFAGCSQTVSLTLPADTPVRITADSHQHMITPSDPRYDRLREWLARNQSGWSQVFATNPGGGIIITAGDFWLQFVDATAFTRTHDGLLQKKVRPADYAFLQQRESSNHAMQPTAGRRTTEISMTQTPHPAATRGLASGG
jgi:hypothetical protein